MIKRRHAWAPEATNIGPTSTKQRATATLHWEVRDRFAQLKDARERLAWLQRFGSDPLIASALHHGPAGLTNLSEAERALLTNKVEALADPAITEAKGKVTRALAELERSYRAAPALVAQCAGLNKAAAPRPLPSKPELTAPKGATPPKANSPDIRMGSVEILSI